MRVLSSIKHGGSMSKERGVEIRNPVRVTKWVKMDKKGING